MANRRDKLDNSNPFARNSRVPSLAELTDSMLAQTSTLSAEEDGNIRVGNFLLTSTGMTISGQISHEEWQRMGNVLHRLDGAIQWLIGDWLVYGERVWGETYEQVAAVMGLSAQTLYDYAWVARSVQFSSRKENLSFNHHKLVASMEPEMQHQWLELATEQGLSISQLKSVIEGKPPTLSDGKDPISKFQRAFLPFQQRINRVLRAAGQGDRRKIANWLRQEADRIERGDI